MVSPFRGRRGLREEAEPLSGAGLGGAPDVGAGDHRDHGVPAGQRMVGEEQHRQTGRRDLQRSGDRPLAGQFASAGVGKAGSVQPHPYPVDLAGHRERGGEEEVQRSGDEPVGARSGHRAQFEVPGGRRADGQDVQERRGGGRRADREEVAGFEGRGAEPGERVGGAGPEDGRDGDPAADGEVAAQPGGRRAHPQLGAVRDVDDRVGRLGTAVHQERGGCAGDGGEHPAAAADAQAAERDLDRGVALGVAEQPVGEAERARVRGARHPHAERRATRAAQVLDCSQRPCRDNVQPSLHGSRWTKRTRTPGRRRAGGSRSRSQRTASVRPMSRHPPGDSTG